MLEAERRHGAGEVQGWFDARALLWQFDRYVHAMWGRAVDHVQAVV